ASLPGPPPWPTRASRPPSSPARPRLRPGAADTPRPGATAPGSSLLPVTAMLGEPGADVLDRFGGRRARPEEPAHAHLLEPGHVLRRDDAAARQQDVTHAHLPQHLEHPREARH